MGIGELPGADLVQRGAEDLRDGRHTIEAMLVARASQRLRGCGVALPPELPQDPDAELYALLAARDGNGAHSAYNALSRRLVSYMCCAERDARSG